MCISCFKPSLWQNFPCGSCRLPVALELAALRCDQVDLIQITHDGPDLHWCVGPGPRWIQAPVERSHRSVWGWTPLLPPLQPHPAVGVGWGALCSQKASLWLFQTEKETEFHQATFLITHTMGHDTNFTHIHFCHKRSLVFWNSTLQGCLAWLSTCGSSYCWF